MVPAVHAAGPMTATRVAEFTMSLQPGPWPIAASLHGGSARPLYSLAPETGAKLKGARRDRSAANGSNENAAGDGARRTERTPKAAGTAPGL